MCLDAIQILGGNGYINDYPTGRFLRLEDKLFLIIQIKHEHKIFTLNLTGTQSSTKSVQAHRRSIKTLVTPQIAEML